MSLQKLILRLAFPFYLLAGMLPLFAESPIFFLYSAPKTGTHLLNKAVGLLTSKKICMDQNHEILCENITFFDLISNCNKQNKIIHTHRLPPAKIINLLHQANIKTISIVRDPRDQLISLIFHHHRCKTYLKNSIVPLPDPNRPLTEDLVKYLLNLILLDNIWPYKSYHHVIHDSFALQYLNEENALIIKFEDLVGTNGGGSKERQVECLAKICDFIGLSYSEQKIEFVINHLYGGTWSFRKGKIGEWKKYFSEEHKTAFQNRYRYRQVIHDLGYDVE